MSESAPPPGEVMERAHRFGRHETLIGILTRPARKGSRIPILVLGAGIIHKVGPSRISVRLARSLAEDGHTVLRFDLSGIGDSLRSPGSSLQEVVKADIRDAIEHLLNECPEWNRGICLIGFCSGADNGLYMAAEDDRIEAVAMFDPTIHPTPGFRRRRTIRRLKSPASWLNVLSGRSLWRRLHPLLGRSNNKRPPGYYGLLVSGPDEMDRRASVAISRGVEFLFCLSRGAQTYCNSPDQVRESLPTAYSEERFAVEWRPSIDHVFSTIPQQEEFLDVVRGWLTAKVPDQELPPVPRT